MIADVILWSNAAVTVFDREGGHQGHGQPLPQPLPRDCAPVTTDS
jgi:hypothetical protein